MELPEYQPFYIHSLEELRSEIRRLGLNIPLAADLAALARPIAFAHLQSQNRFCAQPISGGDATPDGAPGAFTLRRYQRLAAGGFALIWVERTSALIPMSEGRALCLSESTLEAFQVFVAHTRASAPHPMLLMLQLEAASCADLVQAARLALEAGFDGVDFQGAHALRLDALQKVRDQVPGLLRATRLCAYEGVRGGFGVAALDYRKLDTHAINTAVDDLMNRGLQLLNLTAASPTLSGTRRGVRAIADHQNPQEHPLMTLERQLSLARAIRSAFPELPLVGSGFGWLRQFVGNVAAGALGEGWMDWAGLGRAALACPDLPLRLLSGGPLEPGTTCMVCFACSRLSEEKRPVGCVIRDAAVYAPEYKEMRRFDPDQLMAGALRCHLCEAAPCVRASPLQTDIPAFIRDLREAREDLAYERLRSQNPLPELSALTAPSWLEAEGACIETHLTGESVPINDLQYALAWRARMRGASGVRVPLTNTGKRMAVVGGGPAGIAAASRLVELGYTVSLHEATEQLGGVPARVLVRTRSLGEVAAEIEALLKPALVAHRLEICTGSVLGENLWMDQLERNFDAVIVATGLWRDSVLAEGSRPQHGVMGAMELLEHGLNSAPARIALLAGGDAAMDAARLLQASGAQHIYVIFAGTREEMHWHMPESWFASPGVHPMMEWRPLQYTSDTAGNLIGVRLRHTELGTETLLPVDLAIEAMGLAPHSAVLVQTAIASAKVVLAGALRNGGASIGHCVADGLAAANQIHAHLSGNPIS